MSPESSLLKSTLSGIISLQDKLCDALSSNFDNNEEDFLPETHNPFDSALSQEDAEKYYNRLLNIN